MDTSNLVKAKCRKTGRYYSLELKKVGGSYKVVNMTDLPDDKAVFVSSNVKQDTFETNSNLLACQSCGNRRVGGCACSKKKHRCSKNMGYTFDCIYCNELEIDYSLPSRSKMKGIQDKVIYLDQNQVAELRYADDRPLTRIYVGVGWDPATQGSNIDVDSSVVVMGRQGGEADLVYFAAKEHASGCVIHHGDNLTGMDIPNCDDENISVYLDKVPSNRDTLVFILNIFCCEERKQTFGGIKNLYIRLSDPDSKTPLIEYKVRGNFDRDTGLIIGKAYREDGQWLFKAIGKGSRAKDVHRLTQECASV